MHKTAILDIWSSQLLLCQTASLQAAPVARGCSTPLRTMIPLWCSIINYL